jgi:IS30 family transposase
MSRKVFISKVPSRKAEESFKAIRKRLKRLPDHMLRSITYDNGAENMQHMRLNLALGTKSYFCAPYHSWEKGAVENINGLIREYVPRGFDIATLSKAKIETIERKLNNRPRKCLGFKTPEAVFDQLQSGALHG